MYFDLINVDRLKFMVAQFSWVPLIHKLTPSTKFETPHNSLRMQIGPQIYPQRTHNELTNQKNWPLRNSMIIQFCNFHLYIVRACSITQYPLLLTSRQLFIYSGSGVSWGRFWPSKAAGIGSWRSREMGTEKEEEEPWPRLLR